MAGAAMQADSRAAVASARGEARRTIRVMIFLPDELGECRRRSSAARCGKLSQMRSHQTLSAHLGAPLE